MALSTRLESGCGESAVEAEGLGLREGARSLPASVFAGCSLAFGLAVFMLGAFAAWEFTVDDAYISLRYSRHLAEGLGLVWNPGDVPVEGFTNFLWVLILGVFERVGPDPMWVAKVIGVVSHGLTAGLVARITSQETDNPFVALLAATAYLLFLPAYFHAVSGLETAFYTLLLTATYAVGLDLVRRQPRDTNIVYALPFLVILLGMTRPDGLLPGGWVLLVAILHVGHAAQKKLIGASFVAGLIGLVYMAWRVQYFGYLLPNTAYLKGGAISSGLLWLQETLLFLGPILLAVVVAGDRDSDHGRRRLSYYLGFVAAALVVYAGSIPLMDYLRRFAFPVVGISVASVAVALYGEYWRLGRTRTFAAGALLMAVLLAGVSPVELARTGLYGPNLENAHVALGKALAASEVPEEERTLAVGDAGAIAYFSRWTAWDYGGLNAPEIAHGQGATEYVAEREPTLLVLYSEDGRTLRQSQRGVDPDALAADYEQVGVVAWNSEYHLVLWVRVDASPQTRAELAQLASTVGERSREAFIDPSIDQFSRRLSTRLGWGGEPALRGSVD